MFVSSSVSLLYALVLGATSLSGAGAPGPGMSDPLLPATGSPIATVHIPDSAPMLLNPAGDTGALGSPIDSEQLGALSGGDSTVDNDVIIDGTVDGNTADGIISGSNVIGGGAFDNATGINTVIQNTGSNVLIQNGMVVNVQFVPPTP